MTDVLSPAVQGAGPGARGRAAATPTLEQENAALREELRQAHEDLATLEEVAQVCATPKAARDAARPVIPQSTRNAAPS
jgi:hypothetical protein